MLTLTLIQFEDRAYCVEPAFLKSKEITPDVIEKIKKLNVIASKRNQSLAQMSLAWLLKDKRITSVLIGASTVEQLLDNLKCVENTGFSAKELNEIEGILNNKTK